MDECLISTMACDNIRSRFETDPSQRGCKRMETRLKIERLN